MPTQTIEDAIEAIRTGRIVILADDTQGDAFLCMAAEHTTPAGINTMVTDARGLVSLCLTQEHMHALGIPLMAADAVGRQRAFGASFEAREGVTTGISAADRATTIQAAVADGASSADIVMPGHVVPIAVRAGGVLVRSGLNEAAVDLMRLAGCKPAAAVCNVLDAEGAVADSSAIEALAQQGDFCVVTVEDIVAYRLRTESLVRRVADVPMATAFGAQFRWVVYHSTVDSKEHIALVRGEIDTDEPVLARIHSQCLTGDVFGSERCDCGDQLRAAIEQIDAAGCGVLVYMNQEGRGIGLANKIRAYALQDQGRDTVEANIELGFKDDGRDYGITAQILRDLGVQNVKLLTNNPKKIEGLIRYGIQVADRVPLEIPPHAGNINYLRTKQQKLGHLFSALTPVE